MFTFNLQLSCNFHLFQKFFSICLQLPPQLRATKPTNQFLKLKRSQIIVGACTLKKLKVIKGFRFIYMRATKYNKFY